MTRQLTVGVPAYNAEGFLERCLENLSREDLDFRIIVADNASTDGTEEIARSFGQRDRRIEYVRHDANMGAEKNFMFLLERADSPLFAWRACDDFSSPGYFETLSAALEARSTCKLAVGSLAYESANGIAPDTRVVPGDLPEDLAKRRSLLLRISAPGWIYGVFRRGDLLRRYADARSAFPHTWGLDTLTLLPFLLEGSVTTCPDATLSEHLSDRSAELYRPKGVFPALRFVVQYWRHGFSVVDELTPNFRQRLGLYRAVVRYADGRSEKYRRIAKRALFWPYYRIVNRL